MGSLDATAVFATQPQSPIAQLEARAALCELAQWLSDLPDPQRIAIVLKELEGLPVSEIATLLGVSIGAAEQLLVRARAALRNRRGDRDV